MPIASTDELSPLVLILIEQILRIDWSLFVSGSNTSFQNRYCLQVVSTADVRRLAIQQRPLQLVQQYSFLALFARSSSHQTRQLAVGPKYQPALKDVKRGALSNKSRVELLSAFEKRVTSRFISRRIRNSGFICHGKHQLQRRSTRKAAPWRSKTIGGERCD